MSLRHTRVYLLSDVSTARTLLDRLHRRIGLEQLNILLVHDWERWLLRVELRLTLPVAALPDIEAIVQEHGSPAKLSGNLRRAFIQLASGVHPVEVMRRCSVPVIPCDEPYLEDLQHFCDGFSRGLGYCPPSLR